MNQTPCPLCRSGNQRVVYDLTSYSGPYYAIPGLIVRCASCGYWFKIPTRSSDETYADEYANDAAVEQYMSSDPTRKFYRSVLAGLENRGGRLLDIGTGLGIFVEEANRAGYAARGVDLCEPLVERAKARGLDVEFRRLEDMSETERFDVITLLDVIEHVPDPLALLASARRLLVPSGELVIYTPNHRAASVVLARALRTVGLDFGVNAVFGCNHLGFFDNVTLPNAIEKSGFALRRLVLSPYDPRRPGQSISLVNLAVMTAVEQLGRPFQRMLRMLAYARVAAPTTSSASAGDAIPR